jgi:hypothetical protein
MQSSPVRLIVQSPYFIDFIDREARNYVELSKDMTPEERKKFLPNYIIEMWDRETAIGKIPLAMMVVGAEMANAPQSYKQRLYEKSMELKKNDKT